MNNEAILNKLVELGYLSFYSNEEFGDAVMSADGEIEYCTRALFNPVRDDIFLVIQDALVSECAKQGLGKTGAVVKIILGNLSLWGAFEGLIYEAPYSRQSVIEAFCKVTGTATGA